MKVGLFSPGYIATEALYNPWLPKLAAKKDIELLVPDRPYGALLVQRAEVLKTEIEKLYNKHKKKIHCIGHSRGGTDLTYTLFIYPELAKYVASVTTMASPHFGARIAEYIESGACKLDIMALHFAVDVLDQEETLKELTPQYMASLGVEPVAGVYYHSFVFWADKRKMPSPGFIDYFNDTMSDGTVSVYSQRFKKGGYTMLEACHKSQTLPFAYGWPVVRLFDRPYRSVWGKVFDHVNTL